MGRGGGEFWPHLQQVPGVGHPRPTLTSSLAGFGSPLPSPHLSPAPLHPSSSHPTTSPAAPGRSSPNISLAPLWCVPPQPPPCGAEPQSGAGGTHGQPPHRGHWPVFLLLGALGSLLWWQCLLLPVPLSTEAALPGDPASPPASLAKEPGQALNLSFPYRVCKMGIKASSHQAS